MQRAQAERFIGGDHVDLLDGGDVADGRQEREAQVAHDRVEDAPYGVGRHETQIANTELPIVASIGTYRTSQFIPVSLSYVHCSRVHVVFPGDNKEREFMNDVQSRASEKAAPVCTRGP